MTYGPCRVCEVVSIPQHTSFMTHVHAICYANKVVVTRMFDKAANIVRRVDSDMDSSIEGDDTINLTVSYDGPRMTRGHKSQYGIGCVIQVMTGFVIDLRYASGRCRYTISVVHMQVLDIVV